MLDRIVAINMFSPYVFGTLAVHDICPIVTQAMLHSVKCPDFGAKFASPSESYSINFNNINQK